MKNVIIRLFLSETTSIAAVFRESFLSQFLLFMWQWSHKRLWTGNLFPWKWMGCHKCSAMTSFQDRVQGEDRQQRRDIRLFQALMTAHCKFPLFEQTMERKRRVKLDWVMLEVAWVGDEGCDCDYSLLEGSCEKKQSFCYFFFVS